MRLLQVGETTSEVSVNKAPIYMGHAVIKERVIEVILRDALLISTIQ